MSRNTLYAERNSFGMSHSYRDNAWIQDDYNKLFINTIVLPKFDKFLKSHSGTVIKIIDLCCGDGFTSILFFKALVDRAKHYNKNIHYLGIDISTQQIRHSQDMLLRENLISYTPSSINFITANVEEYRIPNEEERADMIVCFFGLHLLENPLSTIPTIIKNLSKNNGLFTAILPLRVSIAYRARQILSEKPEWKTLLKDDIRFISEDPDMYKKICDNITLSGSEQEQVFENTVFTHTIPREKFLAFFKSWAPELRGILPEDQHELYLNAFWSTLRSFNKLHDTEGVVSDSNKTITFNDRIIWFLTTISAATPALTHYIKGPTLFLSTESNTDSLPDPSISTHASSK